MNPIELLLDKMQQADLWGKKLQLRRNEYLKVKGSIDTHLYLVLSGSLRIFVIDEKEDHTIRFGYQNNLIAALDSFIHEQASDLYIQAIKQSEVQIVSKSVFVNFIESSQENIQIWLKVMEAFVLQQMERERDILTSSPLERYNRVLSRSPQLFQEIPHKYIASYLRMTPETLSRLKKA